MADNQDRIHQLLEKLDILLKKQQTFSEEIQSLKDEIYQLKGSAIDAPKITPEAVPAVMPEVKNAKENVPEVKKTTPAPSLKTVAPKTKAPKKKTNLEKFIGENLINKIGIIVIIIGVAIGTKYTIEHDLISPLTRVILGYFAGIGLLVIGMRLKKKYKNFSAVLVSGAMAIMYFITFLAYYILHGLLPQTMAFILMLLFTAFTVLAALQYNKQIIAHIGLVGAYAVPFLLSTGSDEVIILFSYMAIINAGILGIAIKKYWKALYMTSFFLSWIIYIFWYVVDYNPDEHYTLGFIFLSVFFVTFYLMFLVYKLRKKKSFGFVDVVMQLTNSFIFYGIGFSMLDRHETGEQFLGLFTLINAMIHFVVSVVIYRLKLADRNLFYFISGMVLIFITIAFPVQLDGNWVTLLWAGEAALLFWIGRTKKVPVYEVLSYPLWALTFFSLIHDWGNAYDVYDPRYAKTHITAVLNINFLTSLLCIGSFIFIYITHRRQKSSFPWPKQSWFYTMLTIALALLLVFTTYFAFWVEINNYWEQVYQDVDHLFVSQKISDPIQYTVLGDLRDSRAIWLVNYTLLFLVGLSLVNIKKIKNNVFGYITLALILFGVLGFLTRGLYVLSELRLSYLDLKDTAYSVGIFSHIGIRYISFVFMAGLMITCYHYVRQKFLDRTFKIAFEIIMHGILIWIVSSELIHWLDLAGYQETYKLGLSILWGVYALLLIVLGIWKKKKYLRILAIIWFGITLIKLFFYDISHLNTISKTIVFLSLGVLLLIISFLYNKYKHVIADEQE